MEIGEHPNHSDWFFEWMRYAQPADWQLDFSGASVDPSDGDAPNDDADRLHARLVRSGGLRQAEHHCRGLPLR
jgi:hypothetical protein